MKLRRPALAWFGGSLLLFALTAATGPEWADSSKLALYAVHTYLPSLNPGDHAGWTLLAHLWLILTPWWGPGRALALFSAVAGAASVAGLFVFTARRTHAAATGHAAAAVLVVAHPLWWSATMVESYAPALALVTATALAATATRRRAGDPASGFFAGLAAGVHAFSLLLTAPLLLAPTRRRPLAVAGGLVAGTAPVWLAVFGAPPDPLTGHLAAGAGTWSWHLHAFLDPLRAAAGLSRLAALLALGFGPVAVWGLRRGWRRQRWRALHPAPGLALAGLALLGLVMAFYVPYRLHLMAGFLVLGTLLVLPPELGPRARGGHLAAQAALYALLPLAAVAAGHGTLGVRVLPDRDNAWYFLSPVKVLDHGAQRYARTLLDAVPHNAVILSDFNPGAVLVLVRSSARLRPDVTVIPTAVDETLRRSDPAAALARRIRGVSADGRPAVLADDWPPYYRVRELEGRFGIRFAPCGPGLLVMRDSGTEPTHPPN